MTPEEIKELLESFLEEKEDHKRVLSTNAEVRNEIAEWISELESEIAKTDSPRLLEVHSKYLQEAHEKRIHMENSKAKLEKSLANVQYQIGKLKGLLN